MGQETGTYISDLVATNPVDNTDTVASLGAQIRFAKSTIKATFPNVAGAVTPTHTELNYVDGVTSNIQAQLDAITVPTLGTGVATFLATPSSANLASAVTGETGSGALVFGTSPTLVDPIITGAILEDVYTITDGAAFEIDPGNGSIQVVTLGASRTPAATNFAAGESVTLMVNDGSAFAITWSTVAVTWVDGVAPALPTTGYGVIELWKVGSTIYGVGIGDVA